MMLIYLALLGTICTITFLWRRRRNSIAHIPGPPSDSWLLGHLRQLGLTPTGEVQLHWRRTYGNVVRFRGPFGQDRPLISDPKALQYIFNTSAYSFQKPEDVREILRIFNGPDLVWSEGEIHKRQRKAMLPAFGGPEARALFPIFQSVIERLTDRWENILNSTPDAKSANVDINRWLSRATLDAIGEAAFDYTFGTLDDVETELGKAYNNIIADASGDRAHASRIIFDGIMSYMPPSFISFLFARLKFKRLVRVRETKAVTNHVAKKLIDAKAQQVQAGHTGKDVLSLLVKANLSEAANRRLSEEELYAEMSIILFAGHETTSTSLTWTLWELARRPDVQNRLRHEVTEAYARVRSEGQENLSLGDLEKMPYFQAVIKESMRYHPAVWQIDRVAVKDVVLPLSKPIQSTTGEVITSLFLPRGTRLTAAIGVYNRDPELWGKDANEFNPERWMQEFDSEKANRISLGVVGNLMNFSSGTRSCIGWRFAMAEMQAFLAELIRTFEYSIDAKKQIRKEGDGVVFAVVVGEEDQGSLLPLRISRVARD